MTNGEAITIFGALRGRATTTIGLQALCCGDSFTADPVERLKHEGYLAAATLDLAASIIRISDELTTPDMDDGIPW